MPPTTAPPTWRLLELFHASAHLCPACGQVHRSLMRLTALGDCLPVLLPPGVPAPRNIGVEIDAHLAEPTERATAQDARSCYQQVAERVRRTSIRCEGCGARCAELEAYRVHPCEVRYR
jgi:predicted RNA-binding Zn-ribbon protein involved in translation (DUF1610 family)